MLNDGTQTLFVVGNLFESPDLVLLEKVYLTPEVLWHHVDYPCKMNCILYKSLAEIQFYGETLINVCHRMSVTNSALFAPIATHT